MASSQYAFTPDVVFPPGETLRELIEARRMTQVELSQKLNLTEKTVSQLLNGKAPLTQDTALKLERVLGVDASFWNNLEARYQEYLARQAEEERLERDKSFLKNFPYREMVKRGWIRDGASVADKLRNLLNYFEVADPQAWENHWGTGRLAAFRKTNASNTSEAATAAWLRAGEKQAEQSRVGHYDERRFRQALHEIRDELVVNLPDDFVDRITSKCAEAGVAFVLLPQLPKTGISGATRWIHKTPIIQLSLRYKREDYFWFAFFHEAAHILLHGRTEVFWSGADPASDEIQRKETEANEWARNMLIAPQAWEGFVTARRNFCAHDIIRFAEEVHTAPGIVVGRLHHEKRMATTFNNDLCRPFRWADER
jgi:HTH-type transcriptional regulator / antitoxin HigA